MIERINGATALVGWKINDRGKVEIKLKHTIPILNGLNDVAVIKHTLVAEEWLYSIISPFSVYPEKMGASRTVLGSEGLDAFYKSVGAW